MVRADHMRLVEADAQEVLQLRCLDLKRVPVSERRRRTCAVLSALPGFERNGYVSGKTSLSPGASVAMQGTPASTASIAVRQSPSKQEGISKIS